MGWTAAGTPIKEKKKRQYRDFGHDKEKTTRKSHTCIAKVVEREEACDRALGASKDKAGAKPAAPPKGKDRKNASVPSRSKRNHVGVDEEESDNEPKLISKKINRRESHTLSDSEHAPKSGTARKMAKSALKDTGKKGKQPAKSAGRKNRSPPPDDTETEPELRKKPKGTPRNRIEVPEEEPEEPESPPPTKARKRPVWTPLTTQMDAQVLVKLEKHKAIDTIRIKRAVPQSDRTLRNRK
ncbi:unnamed protein product [Rhizoctonia solani]|uniref:Uncharacterized protein n=1 Tax=Rhizoctonia solani TaxID=456999 RepID=A0A8H3CCC8_9AGAM|nr:unnamed protein product [Rhizoctonia solani]